MSDNLDRLRAALEGRYRIERELGEGGMATVYLAEDLRHQRKVALKVLRPELAATMGPDRFLQEVRVTANLQHPHILPLFDSGEADGFLYYVMPYLDGESLRERVQREGELPVAEAVRILREVTDALAAAHQMGVVHRDIKPDNVMLSGRHAVVTDFGVAKAVSEATGRHQLTTMGVALGTPAYMAPEQAAANENVDHRADVYAVGAMAYELLAGRPPFSGMTAQQVLSAHVTETPTPVTEHRATVPAELGQVIMRCLEKKPADRWQSAEDLLKQLELFATPTTGITPTQSLPADSGTTTGTPLWMKVAAPMALVAIGLAVWWGTREPATPGAGSGGEGAAASAPVEGPTYVVAPFENQSGVDSLDAFGSVVATYLTSQISRNDIARVAPSSAVKSLADGLEPGMDPVAHYADATGARYVVTGSYFAQGGELVVQAEVAAADGSELVPVGPIQAPMSDFMGAARDFTEVALGVAARILDPDAPPASLAGQPRSYAAWVAYDEGVERLFQAEREAALDRMYEAVQEDSTFVEAYVMAAVIEWQLGSIPRADSLVRVAERYRSEMAPVDALYFDYIDGWLRGDRDGVVRATSELYRLAPNFGAGMLCRDARLAGQFRLSAEACDDIPQELKETPVSFGFTWVDWPSSLHLLGEHEEELARMREMRGYFPDRRASVTREIRALAALGRMDEVDLLVDTLRARQEEDGWELGPGLYFSAMYLQAHSHEARARQLAEEARAWFEEEGVELDLYGEVLYLLGEHAESRRVYEALLADTPQDDSDALPRLGMAGSLAARLGDEGTAREYDARLEALEARPFRLGGPTANRAIIAVGLGELDRAVDLLEEAFELGMGYGLWLRHAPEMAELQGHPAFERFMEPRG